MKKTMITIATVVALSLGSSAIATTTYANPTDDLHSKQATIKQERVDIKKNLSKADAEIAEVLFELEALNSEIVRVEDALEENKQVMEETEADIEATETEIAALEAEITELEERIEERNNILKRRITSYQKTGGSIGFLEVIFGSKNFNEFISRTNAVTKITGADADLLAQQEEDKATVQAQQVVVEEKLAEQLDMQTELEGMKELILAQVKQNKKAKKELEKKETTIKNLKAELETKDSNLASLEADIRRDMAAERARVAAAAQPATRTASSQNQNLTQLSQQSTTTKAPVVSQAKKSEPVVNNTPPASGGNISTAINAGYAHLGTPYRWAGKGPGGFDCSGFVSWSFGQAGISIPSSTAGLSGTGQRVSYSNIQPGDIVFFNTYKTNGHVGIYVGNGQFIGAQNSTGLAVASMSSSYWSKAFSGHVRRVR